MTAQKAENKEKSKWKGWNEEDEDEPDGVSNPCANLELAALWCYTYF